MSRVKSVKFERFGNATDETDFLFNFTHKRSASLAVETDDRFMGPNAVYWSAIQFTPTLPEHVWFPPIGQAWAWGWDFEDRIGLKQIGYEPDAAVPTLWRCTLSYETIPIGGFEPSVHPLLRPMVIDRDSTTIDIAIEKDTDTNDPIQNSAMDQFDPMPTRPIPIPVWKVTKNVAAWSDSLEIEYSDSRNKFNWHGLPKDSGVLRRVIASPKSEMHYGEVVHYWELQAEIENYSALEWKTKLNVLDAGYKVWKKDANGIWRKDRATTADGDAPDTPVLLDGTGRPLARDADPKWLKFNIHAAKDWSLLGI